MSERRKASQTDVRGTWPHHPQGKQWEAHGTGQISPAMQEHIEAANKASKQKASRPQPPMCNLLGKISRGRGRRTPVRVRYLEGRNPI